MRKSNWIILATLNILAGIGFLVAYLIGGYTPFIAIAALWISIGCLNGIIGARRKRKSQ
ncbi:hypothetical protein LARV_02878 [Longilinea arvoryzae]|uniref:Uncharacterized protein n=1 Tax=Longilinea arvoryzae TaxID=360412 RepID=A0A0S7BMY6_9CHLR|nr:hypothetical protein LARV_02878 [Longilinea arvoryzae]